MDVIFDMGSVSLSLRRLLVAVGMMGAMTGLGVFLAPSSNAVPVVSGGPPVAPQDCQTTPGDTFETPMVTPNRFWTLYKGQTIGPWTVTQNNIDLIGRGFWQAADGVQSVDLSGSSSSGPALEGGVARVVDTDTLPLPLFTYVGTFCLAGNPQGGPSVKTGQVLVNGSLVHDFSFDTTGKSTTSMGYRPETFSFTASGPHALVEFRSTTPTAYGPVIDKVSFKKCLLGLFCS
ncbi:MAG TPA: DUF642 domain-containing protein [Pseudonocardiaceae bacterium]|jgi:choice-of-anchor C domain-containing protein